MIYYNRSDYFVIVFHGLGQQGMLETATAAPLEKKLPSTALTALTRHSIGFQAVDEDVFVWKANDLRLMSHSTAYVFVCMYACMAWE